jgi:Stress responsive A/B Barrel Domain
MLISRLLIYRGSLMPTIRNFPICRGLLAAAAIALASHLSAGAADPPATELQLAHTVYFKLKDNSGANRAKLVAACKGLLSGHEGTVYFATGTRAGDLSRDVNDRDFDVSLHMVFVSKEAHDRYQEHARHKKFIEENHDNWEKVRVFDSYLSPVRAHSGSDQTRS